MSKERINRNQIQNSDAAAPGNADVRSEVEVRNGKITKENANNLHDGQDFYIAQNADESNENLRS